MGAGRVGEPPRACADRVGFRPETVPQEAPRHRGPRPLAGGPGVVGRDAGERQEPREAPPLRRLGRRPGAGERRGVVPRRGNGLNGESLDGFVHLHVRSGFSFGFGVARPEELVEAAARMGMSSLALTDRDGLYGIPRFLEAADEAGILPILGAQVSTAGGHVVLLAESIDGYRSLCRLITDYRTSSEDRRRPACPLGKILEHREGLICLTGAVPFGLIPSLILAGQRKEATEVLRRLHEAFGDRLYVELTDDETATERLHLRSGKEVQRLFEGYPDALANVADVARWCAGAVKLSGKVHMPAAILPTGKTAGKMLLELTLAGARRRYGRRAGDGPTAEELKSRLGRELRCIHALGFAPYFLIAHEAKEIAKSKGIPVTGRGSAANSLVSYCLGLSEPEPFSNRLLF